MGRVRHMQGVYCGAKMRTRWKQPNYLWGNALGREGLNMMRALWKKNEVSVFTDMEICPLV